MPLTFPLAILLDQESRPVLELNSKTGILMTFTCVCRQTLEHQSENGFVKGGEGFHTVQPRHDFGRFTLVDIFIQAW